MSKKESGKAASSSSPVPLLELNDSETSSDTSEDTETATGGNVMYTYVHS